MSIALEIVQPTAEAIRLIRERTKNPLITCGTFELSRYLLQIDRENGIPRLSAVNHVLGLLSAMIDAESETAALDALYALQRVWKEIDV